MVATKASTTENAVTGSTMPSLPNELLVTILEFCTVDSLLHLLLTNRQLYCISTNILYRYAKALDKHGLRFLPHQAGIDQTVDELQETLEKMAASWIDCNFKRRVSRLREATGSAETFVFDDYMMRCGHDGPTRTLSLYSLDPTQEDPVNQQCRGSLKVGSSHIRRGEGHGPIAVECYDAGQDLLAFVHVRKSSAYDLDISLYSLRTLVPHPAAIEPVLSIPSHFVRGTLESIYICGRSITLFMRDSSAVDSIILIRWRGTSIFPAIFRLASPSEQILHMAFLDEDHPMILTASRSPPKDEEEYDDDYEPLALRLLEVKEVYGTLANAVTAYAVSYLSEGPHFLFPPLKPNAYINQEMSWILPYHPASACISEEVARQLKPSLYSEPALHAGVFVIHTGGSLGTGAGTEWQIQVVVLKSDLLPWRDQPKMDVEWDTWGPESTRIFQPRPEANSSEVADHLKLSFMTWVETYRTASIAFDRPNELQVFHLLDFNPNTVQQIKETGSTSGQLITDPWMIEYEHSPFIVNVETYLPFYTVQFELGEAGNVGEHGEPSMVRICSTGVLFERDEFDTDEVIVGYCWIDDGVLAVEDAEPEDAAPAANG